MLSLTEADHVRLAALEAIERLRSRNAEMIELECQAMLLDRPITPDREVDEVLVRRALQSLSIAGHITASWLAQDVDELGRPRPAAQRVWSTTDAGVDELGWLQAEADQ